MATTIEDISDSEGFQASTSGLQTVISNAMMQDRSDDEESDHTSDPYAAQPRGRVSPSPYTANTDRARQFNTYVRGMIERKLDILVPISSQPRELINEIMSDSSAKFPEFSSCVRKRIRTFLKSYRRSKKVREGPQGSSNGVGKLEDGNHSPSPEESIHSTNHANTTVVTILGDTPTSTDEDHTLSLPSPKRARQSSNSLQTLHSPVKNTHNHNNSSSSSSDILPSLPAGLVSVAAAVAAAPASRSMGGSQSLNNQEVQAVKQLITGYRESAAFLQRAADQLEDMLLKNIDAS